MIIISAEAEKINQDKLLNPTYQRALRHQREAHPPITVSLADPSHTFQRQNHLKNSRRELYQEQARIANEDFDGCTHAVKLSELKRESEKLAEILDEATSREKSAVTNSHRFKPTIINGKPLPGLKKSEKQRITLQEYAFQQAHAIRQCSNKAIYQYWPDRQQFEYKHALRCRKRNCPVCAHFNALNQAHLLQDELVKKLSELSEKQRQRGRLVHIVLTHPNVELDGILDIIQAWRHVQLQKKKEYKRKKNEYDVWNVLTWGLWSWEVTRNQKTGLFHPHLHILAWSELWLAGGENGIWTRMVNTWAQSVRSKLGLEIDPKAQHRGAVAYWKDDPSDPRAIRGEGAEQIAAALANDSIYELTKYPVKSTDYTALFTKNGGSRRDAADELAALLSMIHGRRLKNGFGGLALREPDDEGDEQPAEIDYENDIDEPVFEVIYTWDRRAAAFRMYCFRDWDQDRFQRYIEDLGDYKNRTALTMSYGLDTT